MITAAMQPPTTQVMVLPPPLDMGSPQPQDPVVYMLLSLSAPTRCLRHRDVTGSSQELTPRYLTCRGDVKIGGADDGGEWR
ncbi:hypothetical protein GCM10023335_20040 [Streptomyces siamensis]|uniref:Uncharacterized protein n=1 Tax=Streptomyces siamensis TaxID=1274986 RepID=A0ABP9IPU5_9ACTN